MSRSAGDGKPESTPWFRRWFGEAYLRLYPHRDEAEAAAAVRLFLDHSELPVGERVLDLACGAGRHLRALSGKGMRTVGLDLSWPLLRQARQKGHSGSLVRGDMRWIPFPSGTFAAVTSFFTSFGYFREEADDRRVLAEIHRVLRPEGRLLLDFLNAEEVRRTLVPRDQDEIDGLQVAQERRLVQDGRAVEKTIRIQAPGSDPPEVFHERVRLYSRAELGTLLANGGFEPLAWFGSYDGAPPDERAPRTIVLARAGGSPPGPTGDLPDRPKPQHPAGDRT